MCLLAREICARRRMNSCIMKQESMMTNDYGHWTHSNKLGFSCIDDLKVCLNVSMRARMRVCIFKCAIMYACMHARTPDRMLVSRYAYVYAYTSRYDREYVCIYVHTHVYKLVGSRVGLCIYAQLCRHTFIVYALSMFGGAHMQSHTNTH